MKVKVTKETVIITELNTINAGETGVNTCEFQLPEEFSSLTVTAAFNNIPVAVSDNKCVIPTLKKGTVVMGVYAYKENDSGVELMYSPKPTAFYVNEGSYSEEIGSEEVPTISEYEKFCKMFTESLLENIKDREKIANKTQVISEESTHDQYPTAKAVYDLVGNIEFSGGTSSGGGLNSTAVNLLIQILQEAIYSTNVSGKIEALQEALASGSGGESGGGGTDTPTTTDDITVSDGIMTIVSVGSDISVTDGIMTIL